MGHLPYWFRDRGCATLRRVTDHEARASTATVTPVIDRESPRAQNVGEKPETASQRFFYAVFLPLGAAANLALGLIVLTGLRSQTEYDWLQVGTGAVCCVIAGWLGAATWSRYYWRRSMARQVALWRRIADAFFTWVEDAPLPADAVHNLKAALDKITATAPPA